MTRFAHDTGVAEFGHPGGTTALERCISLDPARFADEVWSARPLLSPQVSDFADLFSGSAVDSMVSEQGLRTPFLRMAKEGSVLPAGRFTRGGGKGAGVTDQAADDKILELIVDGSTLVLQGLHRSWPPLVSFGSELAAQLGHSVQINAYITPSQNQGFAPHYDTHDVFVLQVAGRKRWTIHAPVLEAPLESQAWDGTPQRKAEVAAQAATEPLIDAVLEPGDALYLPRGYIHSAVAQGELSIHLTVGVHVLTRRDVLQQLIAQLPDDRELRTSLPMGADLADPTVLAPHLGATAAAVQDWLARLDDTVTAGVADGLGRRLLADTRPAPLAPLAQAEVIASLAPTTPVRLRAGLRWSVRDSSDGPVLRVLDKVITVPGGTATAVKAVLAGAVLTPSELPGLAAEDQLVLVRRLLREGVLVPA